MKASASGVKTFQMETQLGLVGLGRLVGLECIGINPGSPCPEEPEESDQRHPHQPGPASHAAPQPGPQAARKPVEATTPMSCRAFSILGLSTERTQKHGKYK